MNQVREPEGFDPVEVDYPIRSFTATARAGGKIAFL